MQGIVAVTLIASLLAIENASTNQAQTDKYRYLRVGGTKAPSIATKPATDTA